MIADVFPICLSSAQCHTLFLHLLHIKRENASANTKRTPTRLQECRHRVAATNVVAVNK